VRTSKKPWISSTLGVPHHPEIGEPAKVSDVHGTELKQEGKKLVHPKTGKVLGVYRYGHHTDAPPQKTRRPFLYVKHKGDVYEASLGEGEPFGKPVSTRDPDKCVSEEISHLVKDKDYEQKRAVAAAYNICKHPDKRSKSIDLILEC
jgi:hypothetical protein